MSVVTGIVICASLNEKYRELPSGDDEIEWVEAANKWISENWHENKYGHLVKLDDVMSCGKHPQMHVYGGGYNYFPEVEFVNFLMSYEWDEPREVFIIVCPENTMMRVYRPNE